MIKNKLFWNIFLIVAIFLTDRVTKYSMINLSSKSEETNIIITSYLSFNLIWNEGIAFGLLSFDHKTYYNFLTILIIIITLIILWMIIRTERFERLAFIMVFGGSLGNIFDRLFYSAVPDFIDFHIKNFHWFIFNVADIFITIGVVMLIYHELFKKNKV
tara:strand:- start:134 stop:610 length:477 start_codon:yes stop_codon:yes gene_type:complete